MYYSIFGFLGLLGPIILIYLLFAHFGLRTRVKRLEDALGSRAFAPTAISSQAGVPSVAPAPSYQSTDDFVPITMEQAPAPAYAQGVVAPSNDLGRRLSQWLMEDWLLKLGALLLIIGFGWLVSYAFLNNWIGPMGRITLGLVLGVLLLALGWWRMMRFPAQGSIFVVLGATAILLTMFAARTLYDFFDPISAMALMFLASAFVGLASVKYRVHSLAVCGIILASVVPLLVASHVQNFEGLFFYLFIVTLGTLWVVLITGWRDLVVVSLAMITLYSIPQWSYMHFTTPLGFDTLTLFAFGFVIVYFIANVFSFFFARAAASRADIIGAVWTGAFLVFWVFSGVGRDWQSLMLALWTVIFMVGAFFLYAQTGNRKPLITYAGVGIMLLGIATARELEGAALTIAFTLEAAIATFLSYGLLHDRRMTFGASALFAIPAMLSLESINRYPYSGAPEYSYGYMIAHIPVVHEHFFVLLLLTLSFLSLGFFFKRFAQSGENADGGIQLHQLHIVLGSVYACVLVWLFAHEILSRDTGTMFALIVYTIAGLTAYLHGRKNDLRTFRIYGGTLLGFVVLRLIFFEVWNMELLGKVITFFLVGILLMSTAFIGRKK